MGKLPFLLAEGSSCVALAWHFARSSTPFGVKNNQLVHFLCYVVIVLLSSLRVFFGVWIPFALGLPRRAPRDYLWARPQLSLLGRFLFVDCYWYFRYVFFCFVLFFFHALLGMLSGCVLASPVASLQLQVSYSNSVLEHVPGDIVATLVCPMSGISSVRCLAKKHSMFGSLACFLWSLVML